MLTMVQMIILVVAVLIAGSLSSFILYYLKKRDKNKDNTRFRCLDFTENSTYGKMLNSDVAVDDIIKEFKILE